MSIKLFFFFSFSQNFGSLRKMLISVFVEEKGRDLKSILLNLDLIQESQDETEELPQYIRNSIELMEQSDFHFLNHQFIIDKFYPVIIADFVRENYFCLQLTAFDNPSCPEEEDINSMYRMFKQDENLINFHTQNFSCALEFNVGKSIV